MTGTDSAAVQVALAYVRARVDKHVDEVMAPVADDLTVEVPADQPPVAVIGLA
jgi:hypothetical protein